MKVKKRLDGKAVKALESLRLEVRAHQNHDIMAGDTLLWQDDEYPGTTRVILGHMPTDIARLMAAAPVMLQALRHIQVLAWKLKAPSKPNIISKENEESTKEFLIVAVNAALDAALLHEVDLIEGAT